MKNPNWTTKETEFLRNNYDNMQASEIAEALGKTTASIQNKANKLGLKKDTKIYTDETVQYIRDNYKEANLTLSKALGIGTKLIQKIRRDYNIPNAEKRVPFEFPEKRKWDEETVQYIKENYQQGNEFFAKELGLSVKTVRRIRKMFGIENPNTTTPFGNKIHSTAEVEVRTMLGVLKLDYESNLPCGNYYIDFVIGNKAIEVQGDYWHCNPEKFDKPEYSRQERAIESDIKKMDFLKRMGYEVLWVWESEISDGRAFRKLQTFLQSHLPPNPVN